MIAFGIAHVALGDRHTRTDYLGSFVIDQAAMARYWLAGAQYGVIVGSLRSPKLRYGLPLGAGVWAAGYAVLPAMGIYRPIWEYDLETLRKDLSAHLVFGFGTAAAYQALAAERTRP